MYISQIVDITNIYIFHLIIVLLDDIIKQKRLHLINKLTRNSGQFCTRALSNNFSLFQFWQVHPRFALNFNTLTPLQSPQLLNRTTHPRQSRPAKSPINPAPAPALRTSSIVRCSSPVQRPGMPARPRSGGALASFTSNCRRAAPALFPPCPRI